MPFCKEGRIRGRMVKSGADGELSEKTELNDGSELSAWSVSELNASAKSSSVLEVSMSRELLEVGTLKDPL